MHRCLLVSIVAVMCVALSAQGNALPGDEEDTNNLPVEGCASAICIEADTGLVLSEFNADERRPAASMVKMMLFLLVSEGLQDGKWTLDTPVPVSEYAQSMGGSQVYLKAGESFPLEQMMRAIAVASANDASIAVAEALWGTAEAYLDASNKRSQELGMIDSHFRSVNGLPPDPGELPDETTARDMAILAQWCVRHPRVMEWASLRDFSFREGTPAKSNTNDLLGRLPGCDGLKTGFTRAAGWCITVTAERDDVRLITVVMGGLSSRGRFKIAEQVTEGGFANVRKVKLLAQGDSIPDETRVKNCETNRIQPVAVKDLWAIVKKDDVENLQLRASAPKSVRAPLEAGEVIGEALAELNGKVVARVPIATPVDLAEAGWRWKLKNTVLRNISADSDSPS